MSHLWPWQKAVVKAIEDSSAMRALLAGDAVYDGEAPNGAPFDYIVVGDKTEVPKNTFAGRGFNITGTLHIWSDYKGSKSCLEILAELNRTLDGKLLDMDGATMMRLAFVSANGPMIVTDDIAGTLRHLPVIYRMRSRAE